MRAAAALALLLLALPARAEEVPPQLALSLMLKVLTYDGNFGTRGEGDFVVLVPFAPGHQDQAREAVSLASGLPFKAIKTRMLKFVALPVAELGSTRGSAVLLHGGYPPELARGLAQSASREKLYTLAFDEALVREGVMLSVASNEGKPQVVVNIGTARQIGADMGSAVLKVARTVQ